MFDTGTCRNAVSHSFLEALLRDHRTSVAVQNVEEIESIMCVGMTRQSTVDVGRLARQAAIEVGAVVVPDRTGDMITGKPMLDALGFFCGKDSVELHCTDLRLPAILPHHHAAGRGGVRLITYYSFDRVDSPVRARLRTSFSRRSAIRQTPESSGSRMAQTPMRASR